MATPVSGTVDEKDWAYLAGIIDGEGSINIRSHFRVPALDLMSKMTPGLKQFLESNVRSF